MKNYKNQGKKGKQPQKRKSWNGLLIAASSLALVIGMNSPVAVSYAQAQQAEEETKLEEIIVTGSRIRRSNSESSTPITTINSDQIMSGGEVSLYEVLQDSPAFGLGTNNGNTARNSSSLGSQFLNLRNLGQARTLVLLNGRRHVPANNGGGSFDISSVPASLVERVETITGGASAVYGSEAISGVVNIILKKDFEGIALDTQYGITGKGDGQQFKASVLVGGNFDDDKGNGVLHISYSDTGGIFNKDRERTATLGRLVSNPADTGSDDGIPSLIYRHDNGRSTRTIGGTYRVGSLSLDGSNDLIIDQTSGQLRAFNNPGDRFRFGDGHLAVDQRTIDAYAQVHYNVFDDATVFFEASFSNTLSLRTIEAANETFNISVTNPHIPQALRGAINAQNLLRDPADPLTTIRIARNFEEFGNRDSTHERTLFRVALGLEGDISESWHYDAYYQYGRVHAKNENLGRFRLDHLAAALSPENCTAFNDAQIQSQAARCPGAINLFSPGSISKEHIKFLGYEDVRTRVIEQHVAAANITGSIAELPAGSLSVAMGVEYRTEFSLDQPSAIIQDGQSTSNLSPSTRGSFNVSEIYGEVAVPLLQTDSTFMKYLEFEGAVRYSKFSSVGGLVSWKAGLSWLPHDDLRVRAVFSRAFRAPNVAELFRGASESFNSVSDPCNGGGAALGSVVAANCAAQGIATSYSQAEARLRNVISGNLDLKEERSDTYTVGFVYIPSSDALEGMTLSVDWFNISVKDAIQTAGASTILDLCYKTAGLTDPRCSQIDRAADGEITEIRRGQINSGFLETSGIDVELGYSTSLEELGLSSNSEGMLDFRVNYTYLSKYESQDFPGSKTALLAGATVNPKHRFNFRTSYSTEGWSVSWLVNYIGSVQLDPDQRLLDGTIEAGRGVEEIEGYRVSAKVYNNVVASYDINETINIRLGINNLFNVKLPLVSFNGRQNTRPGFYDYKGRYFFIGMNVKM